MPEVEATGGAEGDDLEAGLRSLLAPVVGAARARERRHRERIAATTTFDGALLAAASSVALIEVVTRGGHRFRGVVEDVGTEVATMRTTPTRRTLIAVTSIVTMRALDGGTLDGDGTANDSTSLPDHLVEAEAERLDVALHGADGSTTFGLLDGVGQDVARIRTTNAAPVYVRLDSLDAVSLTGSG